MCIIYARACPFLGVFPMVTHAIFNGIFLAQQAKLFSYLHQRADLKVSRGNIPVGFYACMFLGGINWSWVIFLRSAWSFGIIIIIRKTTIWG